MPLSAPPLGRTMQEPVTCKGYYVWLPYIYIAIIHSVAIAGSKIIGYANVYGLYMALVKRLLQIPLYLNRGRYTKVACKMPKIFSPGYTAEFCMVINLYL